MALRKLYSTKNVILNSFKSRELYSPRSFSVTSFKLEEAKATATKVKPQEVKPSWNRALTDAEKCVGHQTSFVSLRYLMNDEVTNWGEHMQKLEGSSHPMFNAAK